MYSRSHHLASGTWSSDGEEYNKIGDFVNITIGKLELKMFHGDITCAKTDVIVIGARQDMDLSKGLLSNKVRKKGGYVIQQELNSQRDLMKSKKMVVTTSGNLPCTYLIHVDITEIESSAQWKTKFDNLLKKTEELQMPSLAIPAFGMHDEKGAEPIAQGLFQALYEHKNPRVLQEVHMVIFEADVKRLFLEEIQKCLRLKDSTPKRFFRQLSRRMLVPFSDQHRSPISEEILIITVHSESDKNNTEAIKMLDEEIKKNMSTKMFENTIIKELSPSQQKSILSIPENICVEVTLNIKSGKIKLVGCQVDVKKAQEDVERVIRQAERNKNDLALFAPKPQQI